jgi:hypothetical protein
MDEQQGKEKQNNPNRVTSCVSRKKERGDRGVRVGQEEDMIGQDKVETGQDRTGQDRTGRGKLEVSNLFSHRYSLPMQRHSHSPQHSQQLMLMQRLMQRLKQRLRLRIS